MTLREKPKDRGVELDEGHEIDGPKAFPDFAIELVWTSGGLDKLEIYRAFGVRAVWIGCDGRIEVHALKGDAYQGIAASEIPSDLGLGAVATLATRPGQTGAVRELRASLRR